MMLGYNRQNITQNGLFAEEANDSISAYFHQNVQQGLYLYPTSFQNSAFLNEISPLADFNGNIHYAVTRSISIRLGYDAWVGNIARPVTWSAT